jgi:hypothetical protein
MEIEETVDGEYEPLLGYVILQQQAQAAVEG